MEGGKVYLFRKAKPQRLNLRKGVSTLVALMEGIIPFHRCKGSEKGYAEVNGNAFNDEKNQHLSYFKYFTTVLQ